MTPATLIADALACVAREMPQAHDRMRGALGARTVALAIGDEIMHVALDDAAAAAPAIAVRTSVAALRALFHGELDPVDAIVAGRVDAVGEADDLVAAIDALTWFLQGAVRCLSIEPLAEKLFAYPGEM